MKARVLTSSSALNENAEFTGEVVSVKKVHTEKASNGQQLTYSSSWRPCRQRKLVLFDA